MPVKIAVGDFETDPFTYGEMVKPFVAGFYDGERCITLWGEDCVARLVEMLGNETDSWVIYFHNGGRFDFFFLLPHFHDEMRIINSRIVQAKMGKHELRDSYAIMPFPLADYDKDAIDYEKMRAGVREVHRDEILKYLRKDLTALYELCTTFHQEFGDKLTVGSASMKQIKRYHKFSTGNEEYDTKFRSDFYYGGRNQVFKSGLIRRRVRIYDINSSYPYCMRSMLHPLGTGHTIGRSISNSTVFVVAEGKNYGAFPTREKNGSLNFTRESGIFHTTIHEWQAAIETGCFKPTRIIKTYDWRNLGTFEEFVTHFYDARKAADAAGDKIRKIFYKYILNSGYGKFAQDPNNYCDSFITEAGTFPPDYHVCNDECPEENCQKRWTPAYMHNEYIIWQRPLQDKSRSWYNIAIGASITGAARANLLRGIHGSNDPLYCDTDSIICSSLDGVPLDDSNLGSWKLEGSGVLAAIAGKKLYAVFDNIGNVEPDKLAKIKANHKDNIVGQLACIKKAHKGARLSGKEIITIADGSEVEAFNPVPNFKWDGTHKFTSRKLKRTA